MVIFRSADSDGMQFLYSGVQTPLQTYHDKYQLVEVNV